MFEQTSWVLFLKYLDDLELESIYQKKLGNLDRTKKIYPAKSL